MSIVGLASRSSARFFAASARATSISSAFSAICARIVTRSGCTSAKPNAIDEIVLLLPLAVPQLADLQHREQRRVPGQDAEVAVGAGDLHLVDRLVHERPIGRHDLQLQLRRQRRDLIGHGLRALALLELRRRLRRSCPTM